MLDWSLFKGIATVFEYFVCKQFLPFCGSRHSVPSIITIVYHPYIQGIYKVIIYFVELGIFFNKLHPIIK